MILSEQHPLKKFRHNIEHRSDYDLMIRGSLVLLIALVPFITVIFWRTLSNYLPKFIVLEEYSSVISDVMINAESIILILIFFLTYSRMRQHADRDKEWRSSLIECLEEKKIECDELKEIDRYMNKHSKFRQEFLGWVMMAVWLVFTIRTLMYCIPYEFVHPHDYFLAHAGFMIAVALDVITFGPFLCQILAFPGNHESKQVEFTVKFAECASHAGIDIKPMEKWATSFNPWIPALIYIGMLVVTLIFDLQAIGLIGAAILFVGFVMCVGFHEFNNHLYNQWGYERYLLDMLEKGESDSPYFETRSDKPIRKENKMPPALIIAELFLFVIVVVYLLKFVGITADLCSQADQMYLDGDLIGVITHLTLSQAVSLMMIIIYSVLMILVFFALLGIGSKRFASWVKVVRSCITFAIPAVLSEFVYTGDSLAHIFDFNVYLTLGCVFDIALLMLFSQSIRKYYTPVGRKVPKVRYWFRAIFTGKLFSKKQEKAFAASLGEGYIAKVSYDIVQGVSDDSQRRFCPRCGTRLEGVDSRDSCPNCGYVFVKQDDTD